MGKIEKKTAKGRLDKWYKLAKEQGYRSRAAFKLVQLNKKYNFLEKARVVIDLCAAPGGWLQVASKTCKPGSLIVGVDLAPIKPIPNCITFVEDITSDRCRSQLRGYLKTWKADVVVHDGAPNVGAAWLQDAYGQAELVLMAMKLACEFLGPGGTFVTKVFRSKDYNNLIWVFKQLFNKVEATKPPSSRNVSAEIFVVCRGYKAPHKLDPRFTDPKSVFEDVPEPTPNAEAKVFHPEKKKRSREGYAENDYTLHKVVPVVDFIRADDPINILGTSAEIGFPEDDEEAQKIRKMSITNEDVISYCSDLQVLGKKDFRDLLRWRLKVRALYGLGKKNKPEGEVAQVEEMPEMDEEERLDQELESLNEVERAKLKRERRRNNERKKKEITRMQMGMEAPMDIGLEQIVGEEVFGLKSAEKHGLRTFEHSEMPAAVEDEEATIEDDEVELDSEDEKENLEEELDLMYAQYTDRKSEMDAKFRVKRLRGDVNDDEWEGLDGAAKADSDEAESEDEETSERLTTSLEDSGPTQSGLSRKAALFFDQDLFEGVDEEEEEEEEEEQSGDDAAEEEAGPDAESEEESEDNNDIEIVPKEADSDDDGWDSDSDNEKRENIDIVTAEAMTLAQAIASRSKSKADLIDEGFNRWAFQSKDGLPDWFLDEETKHNKPKRPVTKEAVAALREKMKALNARPIKKVLEAQGRKKLRAMKKMQRVAKKAEGITSSDMTEGEKAKEIGRMMARAMKKKVRPKPTIVVARGANRGLASRPKGVKGRYRMLDPRMKKELRAQKRIAKKKKKHH